MARDDSVNHRPVVDIDPHIKPPDPWVPSSELRRVVGETPADPALLDDLADDRGDEIDDVKTHRGSGARLPV
jgi:hypothetical protein